MKAYWSLNALGFYLFHVLALGVIFFPFRWVDLGICIGLYLFRMLFVTLGYHRYFSHRSFKTSRLFQFFIAFVAMSSSQKGVLWWAAHHRHHHRHSDQPADIHSPHQGWLWSHFGWILSDKHEATNLMSIQDFSKFPELQWLNRNWAVPVWTLGVVLLLAGGWSSVFWGLFLSTVLLWHGTFTINSLAHIWGTQRFKTDDDSRNNFWLALLTLGEGWHNNHHRFPNAARNGLKWWEIDITFYILRLFEKLGLVWDLKNPHIQNLNPSESDWLKSA